MLACVRYNLPVQRFLRRFAHFWEPGYLPKGLRKQRMKNCYGNAFGLVLDRPEYTYVEGLACPREGSGIAGFVVQHAWCVDRSGVVVDPTWGNTMGEHPVYYGIAFRIVWVYEQMVRQRKFGVIFNWEDGYPVLKSSPRAMLDPRWRNGLGDKSKRRQCWHERGARTEAY